MTQEERQDKFSDFFGNLWRNGTEYGNSVIAYATIEDVIGMDYADLCDYLNNKGFFDIEVTYYGNACQYLLENDCSLRDSLDLAINQGYTMENLSSEDLAGLLASQNFREYFTENEDEIQEFLTSLEEDNELEGVENDNNY